DRARRLGPSPAERRARKIIEPLFEASMASLELFERISSHRQAPHGIYTRARANLILSATHDARQKRRPRCGKGDAETCGGGWSADSWTLPDGGLCSSSF